MHRQPIVKRFANVPCQYLTIATYDRAVYEDEINDVLKMMMVPEKMKFEVG